MKIYIFSPYLQAGGVESLHQLCDACNNQNIEAYICYFLNNEMDIIPNYKNYNIQVIHKNKIEHSKQNWIVIPEYSEWVGLLDIYKGLKRAYWWLSVDNNGGIFKKFTDDSILHLYQSHYALTYILNNNAKYYMPLFDYINFKNTKLYNKEDIICYNPAKDKTIINFQKDIKYPLIPLTNMSYNEIIDTLNRSKIYVDIGSHPGRDRLPRESALCNNLVITNKKGSAYFYNDISVCNEYKSNDINKIIHYLNQYILEYDTRKLDFEQYKNLISNQKSELYLQVKTLFR